MFVLSRCTLLPGVGEAHVPRFSLAECDTLWRQKGKQGTPDFSLAPRWIFNVPPLPKVPFLTQRRLFFILRSVLRFPLPTPPYMPALSPTPPPKTARYMYKRYKMETTDGKYRLKEIRATDRFTNCIEQVKLHAKRRKNNAAFGFEIKGNHILCLYVWIPTREHQLWERLVTDVWVRYWSKKNSLDISELLRNFSCIQTRNYCFWSYEGFAVW